MGKCSCVKWCWEKWVCAAGLCRGPCSQKAWADIKQTARNLVLVGKHPWSILVINLLLEWTEDRDPTWFNLLFQLGYYSKYPLASYSNRKEMLLPLACWRKYHSQIVFMGVLWCGLMPCSMASCSSASAIIILKEALNKKHHLKPLH